MRHPLALFLITLLVAVSASASNRPEMTVEAMYAGLASGNLPPDSSLWDPGATTYARTADRLAKTYCWIVHRLSLATTAQEGDAATVDAVALVTIASDAPGAKPRTETRTTTFELKRTANQWRIVRWADAEEAFVSRVMAGKSEAERDALMATAGRLHGPRLANAFCTWAVDAINRSAYPDGESALRRARELAQESGDEIALANVAGVEGIHAIWVRRDPPLAIEFAAEGVRLAERSGNPDALVKALLRLGRAQFHIEKKIVRPPLERALAMGDYAADLSVLSTIANQLAFGSAEANDRDGQLRYAQLALDYATMSGDDTSLFGAYYAVAESYEFRNQQELALRHYRSMRDAAERAGFPDGIALALSKMVGVSITLGRDAEIPSMIETAMPLADAAARRGLLLLRANLAMKHQRDFAAAERDLQSLSEELSLSDMTTPENHVGRLHLQMALVELRLLQGRTNDALVLAEELPHLVNPLNPRERLAGGYYHVAALRKAGQTQKAKALLEELSRNADAEQNSATLDARLLSDFYAVRAAFHVQRVLVSLDANDPAGALEAAEWMKARSLRAIEHARQAGARTRTVEQRAAEQAINERIADLNRRLLVSNLSAHQRSELEAALKRARLDLEDFRSRLPQSNRLAERLPLADLLRAAQQFTVLEYVVADDEVVILAITPGPPATRRIHARRAPIPARVLRTKIDHLLSLLDARDLRYDAESRKLYDLLVAPVADLIPNGARLCIIPDGDIWRVPFQALQDARGHYLIDRISLYYATSLALAELAPKPRSAGATLLAFANPELHARSVAQYRSAFSGADVGALPESEEEVRAIAGLYGSANSRVFVGRAATETNLKRASGHYGVVHIATHAAVDTAAPLFSAILLAPGASGEDGLMEAREVLDLDLNADLAVLSACSSGAGKAQHGEGVSGLSWAFLAAGCPTTVVSQWKTESRVTARLMIEFHRRLHAGEPAMQSLRRAQLRIRREPRYRHPFYWAPFVVVGAQ